MRAFLALLTTVVAAPCATILLPDGSPAAAARAVPLAVESFVRIEGHDFTRPVEPKLVAEDGTLEVTAETAGRWIILHRDGWADCEVSADNAEVRLQPWQEIRGIIEVPFPPDAVVSYHRLERPSPPAKRVTVFWTSTAPVEAEGGFRIAHVPPGHGSVGLLREARNEQRVQRWRDYPRAVVVPQSELLRLGGGVTVSGRILSGELPALVTLSMRSAPARYDALTNEDGDFRIPGVLPGEYWLSARPDLRMGLATRIIPQRTIEVGAQPLELGNLAGSEEDVEIDRRVEMSDGLLERVRAEAMQHITTPIEKVWIGELVHPTGQYGARVTFTPRPDSADPTRVMQTSLLVDIPGEAIRRFYPEHDLLGWGFRFSAAPFGKTRIVERELRVFPLGSRRLHLPLDEGVSYDDTLALLRAIDECTIKHPESEFRRNDEGTWSGKVRVVGTCPPEILPLIRGIRVEKDGVIEIRTAERPFGGRIYRFKKQPDGSFELIGEGGWVS